MADEAVVNASPLIFLSRGGHAELLRCAAPTVLVPEAVATEIRAKGPDDPAARLLASTEWLTVVADLPVPEEVLHWGIGPGESAVLALALAVPGREAIIDDLAGRKCANLLGVPVRGTLGLVLAAKRRGLLPLARPVIEDLIQGGMYLSRTVLDQALQRVGE